MGAARVTRETRSPADLTRLHRLGVAKTSPRRALTQSSMLQARALWEARPSTKARIRSGLRVESRWGLSQMLSR